MKSATLPFKPLEEFVAFRVGSSGALGEGTAKSVLGINGLLTESQQQVYYRARHAGGISSLVADRLAVSLGVLPSDIWGYQWADSAIDEPLCRWCRDGLSWGSKREYHRECFEQKATQDRADARALALSWDNVGRIARVLARLSDETTAAFIGVEFARLAVAA